MLMVHARYYYNAGESTRPWFSHKIWRQGFHTVESEVEVCVGATVPHPLFEDDLGCKCKLPHEADSFLRIIIKEITN